MTISCVLPLAGISLQIGDRFKVNQPSNPSMRLHPLLLQRLSCAIQIKYQLEE